MTDEPSTPTATSSAAASNPAGARGAVDLSGLSHLGADGAQTPAGGPGTGVPDGLHVRATDATFNEVLSRHLGVPGLLVVWTSEHPATASFLADVEAVVASFSGRVVLVSVDLTSNPALLQTLAPLMQQAFGQPTVPATFGLLQGQPVPLFPGVAPREALPKIVEQLLELAVKNGVTGRVEVAEPEEVELPPLHQKAFDAIEAGDLDGAQAAYREALATDPRDVDAEVGLAQVALLRRTSGADLVGARATAAADPSDIEAALIVADMDLLGGHVEDAFTRLLDLVRSTSGPERDTVRTRLLELFSVVGNHDDRVRRGRTALMNALF